MRYYERWCRVLIKALHDAGCVNAKRSWNGVALKKERNDMQNLGNTQFFNVQTEPETGVKVVLETVYDALNEKGYNPVNQIVGYIMSGDPTYITSHNGARSMIMKVERDELVDELLTSYIKSNGWH